MKCGVLSYFITAILIVGIFSSCKVDYVELRETTRDELNINTGGLVSKEVVDSPTIDFDDIFNETTEVVESTESDIAEVESEINTKEVTDLTINESEAETNNSYEDILSMKVTEDDRVFHDTLSIDPKIYWKYGMTPCEWIYVEPGKQIVSNYKPNTSTFYSIKAKVSSGLKGCYLPIFTKTDMVESNYDARVYIFNDYTKELPDNMLFSNTLSSVLYNGQSVESILSKAFNLTKTSNDILKNGEEYINVIYVTDLDRILSNE